MDRIVDNVLTIYGNDSNQAQLSRVFWKYKELFVWKNMHVLDKF
jgi:hypothetical protein